MSAQALLSRLENEQETGVHRLVECAICARDDAAEVADLAAGRQVLSDDEIEQLDSVARHGCLMLEHARRWLRRIRLARL